MGEPHGSEYHQAYRHPSIGRRFYRVNFTPNGRINHDWVMVNDRQEKHPDGATTSTRTKMENVDACPSAPTRLLPATAALENKESSMQSRQVSLFPTLSKMTPAFEFGLLWTISLRTSNSPGKENMAGMSRLPRLFPGDLRQVSS